MTVNIALTGRFRSGKDSVAAYLTVNYGYSRFAFGDELKRIYHQMFGYSVDGKDREGYQWFGQAMRQRDPDVWTQSMFRWADEYVSDTEECAEMLVELGYSPNTNVMVTDCRQPNEYAALKSRGYVIIRVTCPEDIRLQRATAAGDVFDNAALTHDTESHIDGFSVDYEIINDGTLDELYAKVDVIMAEIAEATV